jgi:hypothetical protein
MTDKGQPGRMPTGIRRALATNVNAPTLWLAAVFALVGLVIAASVAVAVGLREVSLAAGYVAAIAGIAGSLVPPGWTRQVAVPAGVAVALAMPLALLGEGRPVVAGVIATLVFAVLTLAQQDVPTGVLVGALGSTTYVLAVGAALVRDVALSDTVLAALIGLLTAALTTLLARIVHGWLVRRGRASATPDVPVLPGRFASRLWASMRGALVDWRTNVYVRLALRRVVVLVPLVVLLEAWRDPVALYSLIVAYSVTQPTASDTLNRAVARTAGVVASIAVTFVVAAIAPDWVLIAFSAFAMVAGLAYILRSPFVTALGTTVLTVATGALAGTSTNAGNRLMVTLAGAAVGLLATVCIPVPRSPEQGPGTAAPSAA